MDEPLPLLWLPTFHRVAATENGWGRVQEREKTCLNC